jgi:dihydrofolate synthase / folylpolyglutamate synthase
MKVEPIHTRVFNECEDLLTFIHEHVDTCVEKSILVVTSKIVALGEGRTAVCTSDSEKEALIISESSFAQKTNFPRVYLTIKDGMCMPNAGIDESNADGKCILLPKDSFASAAYIRDMIVQKYGLTEFGVLITDSRITPMRAGTVGVALGYAGFEGIRDYRGTSDIFGRTLHMSRTNVADSLATAAVLCMGEGSEQQPLATITDAPVVFTKVMNKEETYVSEKEDLFLSIMQTMQQ